MTDAIQGQNQQYNTEYVTKQVKIYADLDKSQDAQVDNSEAKAGSVFTEKEQALSSEADKIIKQAQTNAQFTETNESKITLTIKKYMNTSGLQDLFAKTFNQSFKAINYQEDQDVYSNQTKDGVKGDNTGIEAKINAQIDSEIQSQITTIIKQAQNEYTANVEQAITQAKHELDGNETEKITGENGNLDGLDVKDNNDGVLHKFDSASTKGTDNDSKGYTETIKALEAEGKKTKTKTVFVNGEKVQIVEYRDDNGQKQRVIVDDEGNTHDLTKVKGSKQYITDESKDEIKARTGSEIKDIKFKKRKVTDSATGKTEKQTVMFTKDNDGKKSYFELKNDGNDNTSEIRQSAYTEHGFFNKKFTTSDNMETVLSNGDATIASKSKNGKATGITIDSSAKTVGLNSEEVNAEAAKINEAKEGVQILSSKGFSEVKQTENGYSVKLNDKAFEITKNGDNYTCTVDGKAVSGDLDTVSSAIINQSSIDNNKAMEHVETLNVDKNAADFTDEKKIVHKEAKNVILGADWRGNRLGNSDDGKALAAKIKGEAQTAEDVFNMVLEAKGLDPKDYDFNNIKDDLINKNPSIFKQDGTMYNDAAVQERLDLPSNFDNYKKADAQVPKEGVQQQGDTPLVNPQGDTPPVNPQGDTPPVTPQGDTPPVNPQGDTPPVNPQGDTPPVNPQGDTPPVTPQGDTPPVNPQGDTPPVTTTPIDLEGILGEYSIDENGNLTFNGNIDNSNYTQNYFNKTIPQRYYNKETKQWTYAKLGLKGKSPNQQFAQSNLDRNIKDFSQKHTIYMDLISKQKDGTKLSENEQKFLQNHKAEMDKLNITFDEDGKIDEKDTSIRNLEPGEEYKDDKNEVIWTRTEDGKFIKTDPTSINGNYEQLKTVYNSDRTQIESREIAGYFDGNTVKVTQHDFKDNKPSYETIDLKNMKYTGFNPLEFATKSQLKRASMQGATTEIRNDKGEVIISCKSGQFYNAQGKEIDDDQAGTLIERANKRGKLSEFRKNYN